MKHFKLNTVLFILTVVFLSGCHFFESFEDEIVEDNTTLSFNADSLSIKTGEVISLPLSISENQQTAEINWSFDSTVIKAVTDNYGAVITGVSAGQTEIRAEYFNGSVASCLVTVTGEKYTPSISNPYVYASRDYVSLTPSQRVKISGSLFGGTPSDSNGFTWSIDNTAVASLSTEGNCCWITGLSSGFAKITLKHSKATYPYSILVDVTNDGTASPYITSGNNIVTIDLDNDTKASVNVSLMNIVNADVSRFTFKLYDSNGTELYTDAPCVINDTAGNICNIEGKREGECILRVTHPSSLYPLDIIIRTVKHSDNSYIELTDSFIKVTGSEKSEIKATILNTSENINPELFTWSFINSAALYADWTIYNGNGLSTGDRIEITGKHTGNFTITVSYPGMTDRNIIVMVRDIDSESSKATTYITTDQNFISMNPGEETQVNILLKDCAVNDINELLWSVVNTTEDGSDLPVIEWLDGNGTSVSKNSRAALSYNENAWCRIKALRNGHATIEISHYKAMYSTKIDIVVKAPSAPEVQKAYLSYNESPVIKLHNGSSKTLSVNLSGNGSESDLIWNTDASSLLNISFNGAECVVTGPAENTPAGITTVSVSHPNCDNSLSFTVYTFGTEDEYNSIPDIGYFIIKNCNIKNTLFVNDTVYLTTSYESGCTEKIKWSFDNPENLEVLSESKTDITLKALRVGKTVVTAQRDGYSDINFIIEVKDKNIINENDNIYLTTNDNIVYFDSNDDNAKTVSVSLMNYSNYDDIKWTCSEPVFFNVSASGQSATITPLVSNSTAVVTVTHPLSQNQIEIRLRCGELYSYKNPDCIIIEPSEKVINLVSGGTEKTFTATLVHSSGENNNEEEKHFIFESADTSILEVNYVTGTNVCFLKPKREGKVKLIIKNSAADFDCEVPVIVSRLELFENTPYLTTDNNVITVVEGDMEPISISVINSKDNNSFSSYKFNWKNLDGTNYAQAVAQNGITAMIKANSPGIQRIEVTHDDCPYPLLITVNVLSSESVKNNPYIKISKNIVSLKKGESLNVTATMLGGTSETSDNPFFTWVAQDTSIVLINPSENNCYIKGLETGMTKITVRNSKYSSSYTRDILVIVEDTSLDNVYIKATTNTLKLRPEDKTLTLIKAELINGELSDSGDFIWWCDDYSLLLTTSNADECSITPKGVSGSTYIHIKHPKAKDVCDILVLVSEFEDFNFSSSYMSLRAGNIYFVPLQVPVQDSEYYIDYTSSDNDICCISGSRQTAYLCARHAGNVNVTAVMKTSSGDVIAEAQMLLSIMEDDVRIPDIIIGNTSIYELSSGEDMILSGIITGGNISEGEKYNLKWEVLNKDSPAGLVLSNATADGIYYGSDCVVSALKVKDTKEFVVRVSHEKTGAETYLYFIVTEKGELNIKLSTNFEQVYKSDGTFKITATVENGTAADAKNITWSTVRQDGVQIVSVSKTKGNTCTVTPKAEGMTVVRASLPGAETKNCQVVVMADATIKLATGNVHVMPGETIEIDYYTEPAKCSITWIDEMNSNVSTLGGTIEKYFNFTVNEAEKKLYITGVKALSGAVAGTIKGLMTSAKCSSVPVLNVFVDYDTTFKIMNKEKTQYVNQILNNAAKGKLKLDRYYLNVLYSPSSMDLEVTSDNSIVKVGSISYNNAKNDYGIVERCATVELIPVMEGNCDITFRTSLKNVPGVGDSKTITYSSFFEDYVPHIVYEKSAGAFSQVNTNDNSFEISDGEEIRFYVEISNENCGGTIESVTWQPLTDGSLTGYDASEFGTGGKYSGSDKRNNVKSSVFNDSNELYSYMVKSPLISLDTYESSSSGSTKTMYRFAHNFDFYKDLPDTKPSEDGGNSRLHSISAPSGKTIVNYIEEPEFDYYLVEKDMVWRVNDDNGARTLNTEYWNNKGIGYWDYAGGDYSTWRWGIFHGGDQVGQGYIRPVFNTDISFHYSENLYIKNTYYSWSGNSSNTYNGLGPRVWSNLQQYTKTNLICVDNAFVQKPYLYVKFSALSDDLLDVYATQLPDKYVYPEDEITPNKERYRTPQYNAPDRVEYYNSYYNTLQDETVYTSVDGYAVYSQGGSGFVETSHTSATMYSGNTYDFYNYQNTSNNINYPTSPQNVKLNNSYKTGDGYLYVDYVDNKSYVVEKKYIVGNANYVVSGGTDYKGNPQNIEVKALGYVSDDGFLGISFTDHEEECTYRILPTLMHEYVRPCINPDPTPVSGYNKKSIGNIVIKIRKASGGQDGIITKTIPVKYTRRNCQAYQSNDWKKDGFRWIRN